jgi:hypothetical protein
MDDDFFVGSDFCWCLKRIVHGDFIERTIVACAKLVCEMSRHVRPRNPPIRCEATMGVDL